MNRGVRLDTGVLAILLIAMLVACGDEQTAEPGPGSGPDAEPPKDAQATNECSVAEDTEPLELACGSCGRRTVRCVQAPNGKDALGRDGVWREEATCKGDTTITAFDPFQNCSVSSSSAEPCGARGRRCGADGNWVEECLIEAGLTQQESCGDPDCQARQERTCGADGAWSEWSVCAAPAGSVACNCPGHFATGQASCDVTGKITSRCRGCPATSCARVAGGPRAQLCESLEVPGGTFVAGGSAAVAGTAYSVPTQTAQVSAFRLDRYEVTVSRLRSFVTAGGPLPQPGDILFRGNQEFKFDAKWYDGMGNGYANGFKTTYTTEPGPNDDKPANHIDYYTALAFCWWDGGRLPTAHEWEYAARGGAEQRVWPWGNTAPDDTRMVANCGGDASCTVADILPVGSRPAGAGRWGQLDLAGSVAEWTLDGLYPFVGPPLRAIAPICPNGALDALCHDPDQYETMIWGGNWQSGNALFPLVPMFWPAAGLTFSETIGFRCARD